MREIRVAIISQNYELSRFFELEALNFGFSPTVFTKLNFDLSGFDVCIVDAATGTRPLSFGGLTVIVGAGNDGDLSLNYPTSLSELQRLYTNVLIGKDRFEIEGDEENKKICFFSGQNNLISYCGSNIQLSEYEIKLLERLCRSSGAPVSRKELNSLLGADSGNIADVYICRLRKKLESVNSTKIIYTVRGQGYKIVTDTEWK